MIPLCKAPQTVARPVAVFRTYTMPPQRGYSGRYVQPLNYLQPEKVVPWNLHQIVQDPVFAREARVLHGSVWEKEGTMRGIPLLAEHLKKTTQLISLALGGIAWGGKEWIELCEGFMQNRTLERLDLSFNNLSDSHATVLALAICKHPRLKVLHLISNQIGAQGGVALAKSVKGLKQAECLSLYANPLGDAGALALGLASHRLKSSWLYLDGCKITAKGVNALAKRAFLNPSLEEITLRKNQIDEEALPALRAIVAKHAKLVELDLSENLFKNLRDVQLQLDAIKSNSMLHIEL